MKDLPLHKSLAGTTLNSMTFLNEICIRYPEAISFAPGRPLEDEFDPTLLNVYLGRYLEYLRSELQLDSTETARRLFQYGNTSGIIQPLIAQHLKNDERIHCDPEDIVVTVGAQEAMVLALRALCANSEDAILVPEPCYVGIVGAAELLNIPVVPVPEPATGLTERCIEDAVTRAKRNGLNPVLLYLVPSHANPSGSSLTAAARVGILESVARTGLHIIEDNPYGLFAREPNAPVPTMKSMDANRRVIYVGSFAKTGFPGARIGYVVADQVVDAKAGTKLSSSLAAIKSMITVNTPPVAQAVIGGMLLACDCSLKARNQRVARRYSDNLNHLQVCLENAFTDQTDTSQAVAWNSPDGGFFTLVEVPFAADDQALARSAEQFGVLWTPMRYFYVGAGGERVMRLSTSLLTLDEISTGIARLAEFVENAR